MEEEQTRPINTFLKIIITEITCISVVIISIVVMKYFFKSAYQKVTSWYDDNFHSQTSISEVIDAMDGGSSEV